MLLGSTSLQIWEGEHVNVEIFHKDKRLFMVFDPEPFCVTTANQAEAGRLPVLSPVDGKSFVAHLVFVQSFTAF